MKRLRLRLKISDQGHKHGVRCDLPVTQGTRYMSSSVTNSRNAEVIQIYILYFYIFCITI
jgi:hypothetical protein